ncbi:flagellar hook-associated protein FlgK [Luteimonas chenhongjianii]|uniref:Flagellar hook-associated protein 1 n=1 Tax=Luteimonas chenhongjianii TaxID=2006110 RepID=A0A290XEU9_9GAMM|nr:flagellar hook-associated protein FlgK [Luteimonas chenhongjianii]ATD67684.1 flagellar hook-associated protein FlgK [Luteimonas chenhongjianii]
MANILSTGTSALLAFQRALSTVSHNVANINTPGYSRQRVDFEARSPQFIGAGYVGRGTQIVDVRRVADDLANARLIDSGGELARLEQLSSLSARVDTLMSDKATGISGIWSSFFDSVSALSSNASAPAERQDMLGQANALSTRFQQLQGQFDRLATEVDSGLTASAGEVNRLASEIARLNGNIGSAQTASPDMLDRRDQMIRDLVSLTGGAAVQQDGGAVNVFSSGGQALVVGVQASQLTMVEDPYRPERQQLALQTQGQTIRLDERVMGGAIGGLLEFRSQVLDQTQSELGRIALALGTTFNADHAAGVDQYGDMGGSFFNIPPPAVSGHAANTGTARLSASIGNLGAVSGRNLVLQFQAGAWSATDAMTGVAATVTGTGTAADPLRVGGMALALEGAAQDGDRFLLQPTAQTARGLTVAISDPARIAAATPVQIQAALGNIGSALPRAVRIVDAGDPTLRTPSTIEFLDANQYMLDGDGPFAFAPGDTISANGWSVSLDGIPAAGDSFIMAPTAPGSSNNGNAALLSGVETRAALNGGSLTLNGAISGLTTAVGSAARQAGYAAEAQASLHEQAQAARESVSGVNLDEEAANMLRLQQAYQAAAQLISTADNLFQSLLGAVRR